MPFKSEKQRKWMWANDPEMAKKWEKEEQKEAVQVDVNKVLKNPKIKQLMRRLGIRADKSKESALKILNYLARNPHALAAIKIAFESVKEERDYKAEYKKYGSSTKAKKYRAELNQYNRKKGTYGNGDGKDASHKGGKIVGFENQSVNRGRAEKSRLKQESVNESTKRQYRDVYSKYYKTYKAFATGVMDLAKSVSKISGDKTDERIILKNFTKQIIPFASLMRSWSKGHEKNPHIDEKIKVKIQNQTKSISEDIVRGNEVHAKTKKELKAAITRSMKEILNGKTPKYDIINGMSGEMIGWKDGNDYIWQPNAIPYAERELK